MDANMYLLLVALGVGVSAGTIVTIVVYIILWSGWFSPTEEDVDSSTTIEIDITNLN